MFSQLPFQERVELLVICVVLYEIELIRHPQRRYLFNLSAPVSHLLELLGSWRRSVCFREIKAIVQKWSVAGDATMESCCTCW